MITGVTKGFEYKMRLVYAHFPININIEGALRWWWCGVAGWWLVQCWDRAGSAAAMYGEAGRRMG